MYPTAKVPGVFYIEILRNEGRRTFAEIIRDPEKPFTSRTEAQAEADRINLASPNKFASVRFTAFFKAPEKQHSAAEAAGDVEKTKTAKERENLQARHDYLGFYVCTQEEADHEDEGNASAGFDGREHYAAIKDALDAIKAAQTPAFTIQKARYSKNMMAVRTPSGTSYKTRASYLAEALANGRYSGREGAYIMSPRRAALFEHLYYLDWNAYASSHQLYHPDRPNTTYSAREADALYNRSGLQKP